MEKQFDADVSQLIKLVTHSIYSHKEIFLRELIANANDALQKAKLKWLEDANYLGDDHELRIFVDVNKDKKIITLIDNGIGMTPEEVEDNIGTIAKSGTKKFLEQLQQAEKKKDENQENNLIGQFGIWFYSVFMVAKHVELETKSNESDKATLRTSTGEGSYEISDSDKTTRGTIIRIHLADDQDEYADEHRIKSLIKKHANYVPVPIMMEKAETPENEDTDTDKDNKDKDKKKKDTTNKEEKKVEFEQVNEMQSIRTKQKSEVTDEEYNAFYKTVSFDRQNDPLDHIHLHIEGAVNYKALLYIPKEHNQFAAMQPDQDYGPTLYVQNVLIKEHAKELLPVWLRFVKWVVETNDLPLNVSREILQNSPVMQKIQASLIKEVIKSLARQKKKHADNYLAFHKNYGRMLKEGIHYDMQRKEEIADIVLFHSMKEDKLISLAHYVEIMDDKQNEIYYLPGATLTELQQSPYLSQFKKHNIDVLLLNDPIDEYVVSSLGKYKEKDLKIASSQDIELEDDKESKEKKKEVEKKEKEHKNFIAFLQSSLKEKKIEKVAFSHKLDNTLAILVNKDGQPSAHMEKIMKAMGNQMPETEKTLHINIDHPVAQKMTTLYEKDPQDATLQRLVDYTHKQALLLEWSDLDDMPGLIKTINELLS